MDNLNFYGIKIVSGHRIDSAIPEFCDLSETKRITDFHKTIKEYAPTPLCRMTGMASDLGVSEIYVKDESSRFGLNSFKVLGGVYALAKVICTELGIKEMPPFSELVNGSSVDRIRKMVFTSTTDGNHGRGVAWAAAKFGCRVIINMPSGTVSERVEAIKAVNPLAEVNVTDMNYDDTVRMTADTAKANGWHLIQDTAWDGYMDIPTWICQGYATVINEITEEIENKSLKIPSHVFLQAGVGSMAGAVTGFLVNAYSESHPVITICEPDASACFYESVIKDDGAPHAIGGLPSTVMAGLNCGEPNIFTWPILRDHAEFFASCPDYVTAHGMRVLAHPVGSDPAVVSGESGAVGVGLSHLIMSRPELSEYKKMLHLDSDSVLLFISTEGDTYKQGYLDVVDDKILPLPF